MTNPAPGSPGGETSKQTEQRIRAVAAELTAAGLTAHVNQTRGVFDLTASLDRPGGKPIEIIFDEDGYVEIAYWTDPDATPAQVVAIIIRTLAVITGLP